MALIIIHTPTTTTTTTLLVLLSFALTLQAQAQQQQSGGGTWLRVLNNSGVSAMHMALMPNNKVLLLDRTNAGPSNISLPANRCLIFDATQDCTAHAVLYDIARNSVRPLTLLSDTWCSSGGLLPDATLLQTGGYGLGDHAVRRLPHTSAADWSENSSGLAVRRWYASNHILPDGSFVVVGGRRQFSYEFVPPRTNTKSASPSVVYDLPLLRHSMDQSENNLYPFVHLLPDGNLFIFANRDSIVLNYNTNRVVRTYPAIPGESRNYPASGSALLLPLRATATAAAEVLICGGAPANAMDNARNGTFVPASATCGRLRVTGPPEGAAWEMQTMPLPRVTGDMLLLPSGEILILNGAARGSAGWDYAVDAVRTPVLYSPDARVFTQLSSAPTERMYHSSAAVLPDARVLVGGSNPHKRYTFSGVRYPTQLTLDVFSPPYLERAALPLRPYNVSASPAVLKYGGTFNVRFSVARFAGSAEAVWASLMAPTFATHGYSMNQRLVFLDVVSFEGVDAQVLARQSFSLTAVTPANSSVAPPGFYVLFVVHAGVPSRGRWVSIG